MAQKILVIFLALVTFTTDRWFSKVWWSIRATSYHPVLAVVFSRSHPCILAFSLTFSCSHIQAHHTEAYYRRLFFDDGDQAQESDYIIENVTMAHAGWYSCLSENEFGHNHRSAWVTVVQGRLGDRALKKVFYGMFIFLQ